MELILISDSKLKVMLSAEDMEKYELDCDNMNYDNTETRSAFWQILDEAKHQTGFDAARDRVFVQVYPSKCGGCEMYVTKISSIPGLSGELAEAGASRLAPLAASAGKGLVVTKTRTVMYIFGGLDDMLSVCRRLASVGYSGQSDAYRCGDGYALMINENVHVSVSRLPKCGEYCFIEEFGNRRTSQIDMAYIREHGACMSHGSAVEELARLA